MSNYELTRTQEKMLKKAENSFMIGRLRDYNPVQDTQNGNVKFFITPLCDEPRVILEVPVFQNTPGNYYLGMDYHQNSAVLPSFYDINNYDVDDRLNEIDKEYSNKLIIFNPSFQESREHKWYKNVIIRKLEEDNKDNYHHFTMIPKVNMEPSKFEQILKKGEYFDLIGFDGELNDAPELILCGTCAYRMKDATQTDFLTHHDRNFERWMCTDFDNMVKIDLTKFDSFKSSLIRADDSIYFIEDTLRNQIMISIDFIPIHSQSIEMESSMPENDEPEEVENKEILFLKGLQQLTIECGLQYEFSDLINFHTSLKTNVLTILAGMSGTGKTQLAYNYSKMLNLSEDNNTLLFMPISPSYTEPGDILGYLNSMNGLYVPSETGLVNFLQHASENQEQIHMIIFDEMNLSQIEYWFSPFISILEKDPENRYLKLYDQDAHCINEKVYPHQIKIGENILMVGTVNIDETTKDFSDRLLDRTFVINLQKIKFEDFYHEMSKNKIIIDQQIVKCESLSEFMKWNRSDSRGYVNIFCEHESELTFLDEFNDLIQKSIPGGGISYRVLKNIGNYLYNIPIYNNGNMILERGVVFDTVVNQTIMTKIRGTESQLLPLIGQYDRDKGKVENSLLMELLEKYKDISNFSKVKATVRRKAEELDANGYSN